MKTVAVLVAVALSVAWFAGAVRDEHPCLWVVLVWVFLALAVVALTRFVVMVNAPKDRR